MTPCVCAYWPVRKLPRLGEHNGIETKKFLNSAPSLAMRSIFGVLTNGWPMQPRASQRRSSTRMKMILGRAAASADRPAGAAKLSRQNHKAKNAIARRGKRACFIIIWMGFGAALKDSMINPEVTKWHRVESLCKPLCPCHLHSEWTET